MMLRTISVLALVVAVSCRGSTEVRRTALERSSFETSLDNWTPAATDTLVGSTPIQWWVKQSTARATVGTGSAEFFADNRTDAAKVFIYKSYSVSPGGHYDIEVTYDFASRDFGSVNHWQLLTGVFTTQPTTSAQVLAGAQTNMSTGNGAASDVGYLWSEKKFTLSNVTTSGNQFIVLIGVWGTWETARTYYVDDVRVKFTALD